VKIAPMDLPTVTIDILAVLKVTTQVSMAHIIVTIMSLQTMKSFTIRKENSMKDKFPCGCAGYNELFGIHRMECNHNLHELVRLSLAHGIISRGKACEYLGINRADLDEWVENNLASNK